MIDLPGVTVSGRSGGRALLLIHPMGADRRFWDACRSAWDRNYLSIACDLPGAGDLADAPRPYSFAQYVNALSSVVDKLRTGPLVVIGCAVGAMISARFSNLNPERVAGVIMSNPGIRTRDAARIALTARAAAVRSGGFDAILPAAVEGAFAGCPDDAAKALYVARFRSQQIESYAATIDAMLTADVTEDVRRIQCPLLLVVGGKDMLLPKAHSEEIKMLVPSAELQLIEDGAHFIPYQRAKEFSAVVSDFIERRCPTPA